MEILSKEYILNLIQCKKYSKIKELFELYPEIDIAETCNEFDQEEVKNLIMIFRIVKSEHTAEFFSYLNQEIQETLISTMSNKDVSQLIDSSSNDDIADFLEDMPANLVKKVLQNSSKEDRNIINKLLNFKDDTAGSIMTTEYLEYIEDITVDNAIKDIRKRGKDAETIYTLFVKDKQRNFLGTVDLDDLIFANENQTLKEIMNKDFVTVDINTDQEKVAELVGRYNLNAIAVLNDDKRLVGIITVDDILDVINKEANEDMSLHAGVTPLDDNYKNIGVFKMAFKCIPWLIILLIVDVFSSMILSGFQGQLAKVAVLAAFIPTIMDTGGNAGSQTSSVMVRSIALNEFDHKDFFKILWKEFRISLIVASICALAGFTWFMIEMYVGFVEYPIKEVAKTLNSSILFTERCGIAALVSITLFFTILISKLVGCILPLFAKAIKKDPALMSGPLITSVVDVTSLLVYFGIFEIISHLFGLFQV